MAHRGGKSWGRWQHEHLRGGHRSSSARTRWWSGETERWEITARIERFIEPALLLMLRDTEMHGYELADALDSLNPDERVDLGNLYRLLRSLEEEELVTSTWRDDLPGRAKRTYMLTAKGAEVLAAWAEALERAESTVAGFLRRYHLPPTG